MSSCSFILGEIAEKAYSIFKHNWNWEKPVRSIGVRATDLVTADTFTQLSIFDDEARRIKLESLEHSIDNIRQRFGHYSLQRALMLKDKALNSNPIEDNVVFPVSYFR